jgi:hypothetical protein
MKRNNWKAGFQSGIFLPEDFEGEAAPEGTVSRQLLALWMVRAMGYGPIAKISNRIQTDFIDQDQLGERYANAVGILQGLKVIQGDGQKRFHPQRPLTRGEAAKMIYGLTIQPTQPRPFYGK